MPSARNPHPSLLGTKVLLNEVLLKEGRL